jgi:PAS domain S-box-containing protein
VSTRTKLLLAQLPLAIAVVLLGIVATRTLSSLGAESGRILQDNYRSVLAAESMKDALERMQDAPTAVLIRGSADPELARAKTERRRFESELQVQERNITEPGEAEATSKLRTLWNAYLEQFDRFLATADVDAARTLFLQELTPAVDAIRSAADRILALNQEAMSQKSERARQSAARLNTSLMLAACLTFLGGVLLSVLITNRIVRPLALLTRAVQQIGQGDFDARISIAGRDELAQLAANVNTMAARLKQYRQSSLGEMLLAQQASQAAIDSLPDPVIVFDASGGVLNANRAAEEVLGLTLEGAQGNPLGGLPAAFRAVLERARDHVLKGKGTYTPKGFEEATRIPGAAGERYFLPRATPVYAQEGDVAGAAVTLQDVTRLRRVDELRNDMVATLAHELCTPLTSLRMGIHLCLEQAAGPLTEPQSDLLYACRDDCDRLQSTVDELLHLARIQGACIELDQRATGPASLVETTVDAHRALAAKHYVQLESDVPAGVSDVRADRERARVVLANLLMHAIRRSPPGAVVTVRVRPEEGEVRFEVTDTGAMVPKELQSAIFDRFGSADDGEAGAGVSLSFAKEIVEAHGGRIGVESGPGPGSTFWFTLPSIGAPAAAQPS